MCAPGHCADTVNKFTCNVCVTYIDIYIYIYSIPATAAAVPVPLLCAAAGLPATAADASAVASALSVSWWCQAFPLQVTLHHGFVPEVCKPSSGGNFP